jgi:hypothetical protein
MKSILWASLDRTLRWIKFAEAKSLAILGIQGVALGLFLNPIMENHERIGESRLVSLMVGTAFVFSMISMYFCFKALNPKLSLLGRDSPIYFGSIARSFTTSSQYLNYLQERMSDDSKIEHEIADQLLINNQIAWQKFVDSTYAIRLAFLSLIFWTVSFIMLIYI